MANVKEISKGLAGRYLKKVPASAAHAGDQTGTGGMGQYGASDGVKKGYEKQRKAGIKKFIKRHSGTGMAVDKLTGKAKVPATESFIIPETIKANERTAFHGAAAAAHKAGKSSFSFNGKKHPVTMKKDTANAIKTESVKMTIREKLVSILEGDRKAHYKEATPAEPHGQYDSPGGKKMKKDMKADGKPEVGINGKDVEQLGHDDAAKAGRVGPTGKKRPNDGSVGDKSIINKIASAYKEMKNGN